MKAKKSFIWLGILLLATIWILVRKNNIPYNSINGLVFGTIYNITYQYDGDLKPEIEAELKRFDASLSPFNDTSVISRVNRNEDIITDSFLLQPFHGNFQRDRWCFRHHHSPTGKCLGIWFQTRSISRFHDGGQLAANH